LGKGKTKAKKLLMHDMDWFSS